MPNKTSSVESLSRSQYVPWIRWKQGEYQALFRLSQEARDSIVPLIEVAEVGFDFEARIPNKSIDEHLRPLAKRVKTKWGSGQCFVDTHLIAGPQRMADGQHPVAFLFNDLRSKGTLTVPVTDVSPDPDLRAVVKDVVAEAGHGLCLRVGLEEAVKHDLNTAIDTLLGVVDVAVEQCDFILDLGAPNFEPIDGLARLLEGVITTLPYLKRWRSLVLIGTSFPASMGEVRPGLSEIPRHEWRLYRTLVALLKQNNVRLPNFGDYAINHPAVLQLDMRLVKPSASVRYTIEDGWLIAKGRNVRDYKFGQYRGLCEAVVNSKHYLRATYSRGDQYIQDCSTGTARTGNLTTWRWVGTNHHLEKVARDVASFAGS